MRKRNRLDWFTRLAVPVLLVCVAVCGRAQTEPEPATQAWLQRSYMLGDWGGERTKLEEKGVTFGLLSVNDFLVNGKGDDANWSRVRATVDVDFGKAGRLPGLSFHITGLWQGGGNQGAYIGSTANPSSLVSANTARLDSWWLEQRLMHDKLFIRVGQFAGLDFYGVQADGGSYVLEPLGYALGNLFSADYETFDPAATPAAEIRVVPSKHVYWKSAIFSGNRDPYRNDPNGFHFKFRDSPVTATEVGYLVATVPSKTQATYPGEYKFGATINPGPFTDLVSGAPSSVNYLLYWMANQTIYRPDPGSSRGLDVNLAFDWTPGSITRNYSQFTAGFRYHGLIPNRHGDTLAVGLVHSRISPELNQANTAAGLSPFGSEKALEVNYSLKVAPWMTFQPVLQHYFDTGAASPSRNSTVAGFRTTFIL